MTETTTWYNQQVAALTPGTVLNGKYELIQQVGRGGMGVVWKAKDKVADRLVALKFVPNDLARFDTEIKRLRESFQIVHELQHPSICPLYSLEDGGHLGYYHVMKYSDTVLQKAANAALYKALAKSAADWFSNCNEFVTAIGVIVWVSRGGLRRDVPGLMRTCPKGSEANAAAAN